MTATMPSTYPITENIPNNLAMTTRSPMPSPHSYGGQKRFYSQGDDSTCTQASKYHELQSAYSTPPRWPTSSGTSSSSERPPQAKSNLSELLSHNQTSPALQVISLSGNINSGHDKGKTTGLPEQAGATASGCPELFRQKARQFRSVSPSSSEGDDVVEDARLKLTLEMSSFRLRFTQLLLGRNNIKSVGERIHHQIVDASGDNQRYAKLLAYIEMLHNKGDVLQDDIRALASRAIDLDHHHLWTDAMAFERDVNEVTCAYGEVAILMKIGFQAYLDSWKGKYLNWQ